MKVAVHLRDRLLGRAIVDLLRSHGHEADTGARLLRDADLRIVSEETAAAVPEGTATLFLKRAPERSADRQPGPALRRALAGGGTAVWAAPLDTRVLLEVLGGDTAPFVPATAAAPDLAGAPHAWFSFEVDPLRVVAAHAATRTVLDLDQDLAGVSLHDLGLPPTLVEALVRDSDGVRVAEIGGERRVAAWWTGTDGRRAVAILDAPLGGAAAGRHHESLAQLGRTAATLAHEIRNPVASLAGALDLLEGETGEEDRAEILSMARERLRYLSRLLEKTLSLARPIEGPPEVVEVQPVIASAVATLTMDARFQAVRVAVVAPPQTVRVQAYEGPLVQALTNLLLNAAQAQGASGIIHVSVRVEGHRALIRVHDEGPGIPPAKRELIFTPFYTTKTQGTGLGLAEVRHAVTAMGGAVAVEDVDEGACLRIELYLAGPHGTEPVAHGPVAHGPVARGP